MPGSSAESQDDIDSESDDETKRSPAEQKKFIVSEENLDKLFAPVLSVSSPMLRSLKHWLVAWRRSIHYVWMDTRTNGNHDQK